MRTQALSSLAALPLLIAPVGAEVRISHVPVQCSVAGELPQLEAGFDPVGSVGQARLFFRSAGSAHWYWVEMISEGVVSRAVLPAPQPSLEAFEYYVAVVDTSFDESRTEAHRTRVVAERESCGEGVTVAAAGAGLAAPVRAPAGAPPSPVGFGVSAAIAGAPAGAAASAAGGAGLSAGWVVAGAAAVGGGVALVATGSDSEEGSEPSAPLDLSGAWSGERVGVLLDESGECSIEDDATLVLEQSDSAIFGTLRLVVRATSCPSAVVGFSREGVVEGRIEGSRITFSSTRETRDGPASGEFVGVVEGDRMGGTYTEAIGGGSWSLAR